MPGGTGNFANLYYMSMSGSAAAVSAEDSVGKPGVYAVDVSGGGISTIVDPNTLAPDGSGNFRIIGKVSSSGSNVCFGASNAAQAGTYAWINGALMTIMHRSTLAPEGGVFTESAGESAISGNNVVFQGFSSTRGFGIYVWRDGVITRVISEGDVLNGHTIYNPHISTEAIEGDTIAFSVSYGSPATGGGVYTATFIPAPSTLALLAGAGLMAARRKRRERP
jgi:hypothetical protein